MRLRDELPVDHRLAQVYRYGAGLCGVVLLVFGCLGFADRLTPFDTDGTRISGMSTNGVLSLISVVVGLALIGGAAAGGNFASTLNMTVGTLFLFSGFFHIFVLDRPANVLDFGMSNVMFSFVLDRPANVLDFGMSNVMFSFVMGLLIACFGMYGRVSSRLPHDNPYWRRRHPREAAREALVARRRARQAALTPAQESAPAPALMRPRD